MDHKTDALIWTRRQSCPTPLKTLNSYSNLISPTKIKERSLNFEIYRRIKFNYVLDRFQDLSCILLPFSANFSDFVFYSIDILAYCRVLFPFPNLHPRASNFTFYGRLKFGLLQELDHKRQIWENIFFLWNRKEPRPLNLMNFSLHIWEKMIRFFRCKCK